jgi:ATP synthase protein I
VRVRKITAGEDGPGALQLVLQSSEMVLGAGLLLGLGAWAGFWLDGRLHTRPWLTLILPVLGAAWAMGAMVAKALAAAKGGAGSGKDMVGQNGRSGRHADPAIPPAQGWDSEEDAEDWNRP